MADITVSKKKSFGKRVKSFFVEIKSELKKCTWPTREQLLHNTLVIIGFVAVIAIILGVLDLGFEQGLKYILEALK